MEKEHSINSETLLNPGYLLSVEIGDERQIIEILNDELRALGQKIPDWKNPQGNRNFNGFIGGHPVSLNQLHLNRLLESPKDFLVCEKSDGVRFIFIGTKTGDCYLHGRKMASEGEEEKQYFKIDLKIPTFDGTIGALSQGSDFDYVEYIFDGELVIDSYNEKRGADTRVRKRIKYLIFDTLLYKKELAINQNYVTRLVYAKEFLYDFKMRKSLMKKIKPAQLNGNHNTTSSHNLGIKVYLKDFFDVERTEEVFKQLIPNLAHKNDGLIFTRISAKYLTDRNEEILKWKPPHLNTIDFLVVKNPKFNNRKYGDTLKNRVFDLYVRIRNGEGSFDIFFDFLFVTKEEFDKINGEIRRKTLEKSEVTSLGVIAECSFFRDTINEEFQIIYDVEAREGSQNIILSIFKLAYIEQNEKLGYQPFESRMNERISNSFKGCWKFNHFRLDKEAANSLTTAKNITESIDENITQENLLKQIIGLRARPKIGVKGPK
jgi:mRNA guanylyltransferase